METENVTEALSMALAYLEGADPLSTSGGIRNDHVRAVIRAALPQMSTETPVHYWWSGHDQIGHFYAKDDEVVPPGGYKDAPAKQPLKCGIPGAECSYGACTCRRDRAVQP